MSPNTEPNTPEPVKPDTGKPIDPQAIKKKIQKRIKQADEAFNQQSFVEALSYLETAISLEKELDDQKLIDQAKINRYKAFAYCQKGDFDNLKKFFEQKNIFPDTTAIKAFIMTARGPDKLTLLMATCRPAGIEDSDPISFAQSIHIAKFLLEQAPALSSIKDDKLQTALMHAVSYPQSNLQLVQELLETMPSHSLTNRDIRSNTALDVGIISGVTDLLVFRALIKADILASEQSIALAEKKQREDLKNLFANQEIKDEDNYEKAVSFYENNKFAKAKLCFEKCRNSLVHKLSTLNYLGLCAMKLGHYKEAADWFERADTFFKEKQGTLSGELFSLQAHYDAAKSDEEKAGYHELFTKLSPTLTPTHKYLARQKGAELLQLVSDSQGYYLDPTLDMAGNLTKHLSDPDCPASHFIDTRGKNGETALMIACKRMQLNTVNILLHHGANKTLKDLNGNYAFTLLKRDQMDDDTIFMLVHPHSELLLAIQSGDVVKVNTHLDSMTAQELNLVRDLDNCPLLHSALNHFMDEVESINQADSKQKTTPSQILQTLPDIVVALLEGGFNPNLQDEDGRTALEVANDSLENENLQQTDDQRYQETLNAVCKEIQRVKPDEEKEEIDHRTTILPLGFTYASSWLRESHSAYSHRQPFSQPTDEQENETTSKRTNSPRAQGPS